MFSWIKNLFKKQERVNHSLNHTIREISENNNEVSISSNIKDIVNQEPLRVVKNYEILHSEEELPVQMVKWNSTYTYTFEEQNIEGYKILREERIVGCYYRTEHIDEVINTFHTYKTFKFKLVAEMEHDNKYDSNARKISIVYLSDDNSEVRKMHIGYLSRESAADLKDFLDIKVALTKIENINYKDTNLAIYLKSEIVDEIKEKEKILLEKRKKAESERKLRELNSNVAFNMNQLAMNLEKMGKVEEAVERYTEAIKFGFDGSYAFDRLNIYYRKNKDYDNEIITCEQAIKLFEDLEVLGRCDATGKLLKYRERLAKATELKQKAIEKDRLLEEKIKAKKVKSEVNNNLGKDLTNVKSDIKEINLSENTRVCTVCKIEKPIDDFEKNGTYMNGNIKYRHQCKSCRNELRRDRNKQTSMVEK